MKVALSVLTFQRPVGLRRALESIGRLELPVDNSTEVEVVVVVVDNDAAGSAAAVVQAIEASYPWPLHYVVQPDRGIPQARNLAVAVARELGGDLLGFIDDDEEPASDWFVRSLESSQRTGAHVVMGRSMPVFHGDPPQWVMQGRFFERPRFATDEPIRWNYARTSGVLISMKSFPPLERPFDERLRLTGGSDTRFFQCVERAGGIIVWADDAVVLDHVPASRAYMALAHQAVVPDGQQPQPIFAVFRAPELLPEGEEARARHL